MEQGLETLDRCPHCGSPDLVEWLRSFDHFGLKPGRPFLYMECRPCRLRFLATRPSEADSAAYYTADYEPYQSYNKNQGGFGTWWVRRMADLAESARVTRAISSRYKAAFRRKAAVLDYGCGSASFLNKARKRGARKTIGMDFADTPLQTVTAAGHIGLRANDEGFAQIADGSLDLVRINHVVEHLYHPVETLEKIARKMAIGGVLNIAVPYAHGGTAEQFGENWLGLQAPVHVIFYDKPHFREILDRLGFGDIEIFDEAKLIDMLRSNRIVADRRRIEGGEPYPQPSTLSQALLTRHYAATGRADRLNVWCVRKR